MLYQLSYAHHNSVCGNGPPERTRTSDLRIRSPLLYPAELQAEVSTSRHYPPVAGCRPRSAAICGVSLRSLAQRTSSTRRSLTLRKLRISQHLAAFASPTSE